MVQTPPLIPFALSVTELTRYLRQILENDEILQDLWVSGEISNFTRHTSGHIYFTLKDTGASLRCVIWKSMADRIRFQIESGMAVEAHGSIGIYEPRGEYQLYVTSIRPAGEGMLYQEFLRLKNHLEAEGYFDQDNKKPIPEIPKQIGIVTSATGAALQDILNTLNKRYRLAEVILAPAAVQGTEAPDQISKSLSLLNKLIQPDVIILARGGGSLEDLWAFNDEKVVKAIFESKAPVICGVGHETDFTLADFAADLRAPTPTAAAVLATPDSSELSDRINNLRSQVEALWSNDQESRLDLLKPLIHRLNQNSPVKLLWNNRQRLDEVSNRHSRATNHHLNLFLVRSKGLKSRLQALNPVATLNRGFSIVTNEDGNIIQKIDQVAEGNKISIQVSNGSFKAKVT